MVFFSVQVRREHRRQLGGGQHRVAAPEGGGDRRGAVHVRRWAAVADGGAPSAAGHLQGRHHPLPRALQGAVVQRRARARAPSHARHLRGRCPHR